eukprot:scaffold150083_cov26-Cyclotella_meneghiniana.AAC.2
MRPDSRQMASSASTGPGFFPPRTSRSVAGYTDNDKQDKSVSKVKGQDPSRRANRYSFTLAISRIEAGIKIGVRASNLGFQMES